MKNKYIAGNHLLDLLSVASKEKFYAKCDLVQVKLGEILNIEGNSLNYAYFPLGAIVSMDMRDGNTTCLTISLVGNEGMVCSNLIFGSFATNCRAVVQSPGFALRISVSEFHEELTQNKHLHKILERYAVVSYEQNVQTALCLFFHLIESRLAKLLLMFQHKLQSMELPLTQVQIAKMLGVRRVGITRAASKLKLQNIITYNRGKLIILDLNALKEISCNCYETDLVTYKKTLCDTI